MDLPAPLRPRSPRRSPSSIWRLTESSRAGPAKVRLTLFRLINVMGLIVSGLERNDDGVTLPTMPEVPSARPARALDQARVGAPVGPNDHGTLIERHATPSSPTDSALTVPGAKGRGSNPHEA